MALGDIRELVAKLADLDARLRELNKKVDDLTDRVGVIEDHSINHENRLQDLEDDDDNDN
jgi:chromosome segregation ATPase